VEGLAAVGVTLGVGEGAIVRVAELLCWCGLRREDGFAMLFATFLRTQSLWAELFLFTPTPCRHLRITLSANHKSSMSAC
jgi:hypothetical protein